MAPINKKRHKTEAQENEEHERTEDPDQQGSGEDERNEDQDDGEFSLDDVLRLGGTKADFIFLAHLDDSSELVDGGKKWAIDDLEEGELERFIAALGVRQYAGQQVVPDPPPEGAGEGGEDGVQQEAGGEATTQKKEKKKKKKKQKQKEGEEAQDGGRPPGRGARVQAGLFDFHPRQVLLVRPGAKWHQLGPAGEVASGPQDPQLVGRYQELARQLLEAECALYRTRRSAQKGASSSWVKGVVSTGTLADRMAAMTLLVQDAPVHTLEHVEALVSAVRRGGARREGLMALETLRELLLSDLLPEGRKLLPFARRPLDTLEQRASGNRDARDRRLLLWLYEHRLKLLVAQFVVALDAVGRDNVPAAKAKALATAHELLCSRPEQEGALLSQVVNKLGDPEYRTATRASHLLGALLRQHPSMKGVVCGEVERLVFRANVSRRSQYYAVCFLGQLPLERGADEELAVRLIALYFSFFRACVKRADLETKMLSALLSGVNRAYPYARAGDEKVHEQLDTLFRVVHVARLSTAVQALMLLFQVMDAQQTVSDRYYCALYRKLLDPGLASCCSQGLFLNLLYRSLKADVALRRIKAFIKRLLLVSCQHSSTFACGALFLVSTVMRAKPGLQTLLQDTGDGEEESFKDLPEGGDDDDGEERFVDADKLEEEQKPAPEEPKPTASWVHHRNMEGGKRVQAYDPCHRNPLYCGADQSPLWELLQLSRNFHPSVSLFARTILEGGFIQYTGDPMQDFTLSRFLDRFVFRNPKQQRGKQNTEVSVMQPRHKIPLNNARSLPVNCKEYLAKEEGQIPVDEIFFYRFFKKREAEKEKLRQLRGDEGDGHSLEDVDDEEFERILDSCEADSYFTDVPDSLDFAGNVRSKGQKRGAEEDSDSSDLEDDLDDEEVSLGSLDEEDFGDELEEEGGTFMDPDDEEVPELEDEAGLDGSWEEAEPADVSPPPRKAKRKSSEDPGSSSSTPGPKKKKKGKDQAIFTSAEQFGSILDDNTGSMLDHAGLDAMANKDKASQKQLKWEGQRDDWLCGRDVKTLRRKKAAFSKRKMFGRRQAGGRALMTKRRK